jgi:hypothetical protein
VVRFELSAETFARLRQARQVLDDEHGTSLPDDAFMAALCDAVLDSAPAAEPTDRAKLQIAVTLCRRCRQGWQAGAGAQIAIDSAAVDRALCDAQHLGLLDGAAPERAHQDISPSVARFVWRRDGGCCRSMAVARREGWNSTTWSTAPPAAAMRPGTSSSCAAPAMWRTTEESWPSLARRSGSRSGARDSRLRPSIAVINRPARPQAQAPTWARPSARSRARAPT